MACSLKLYSVLSYSAVLQAYPAKFYYYSIFGCYILCHDIHYISAYSSPIRCFLFQSILFYSILFKTVSQKRVGLVRLGVYVWHCDQRHNNNGCALYVDRTSRLQ